MAAAELGNDDWIALTFVTVNVSGGAPYQIAAPGGDGGKTDLRTGVNADTGDGRDGDLTDSITIDGGTGSDWVVKQYRQVAPLVFLSGTPLVITIRGNVEIRCQYLFAPTKVVSEYEPGSPPPRLRVRAGPSLWISRDPCPGTLPGYCEVRPTAHGMFSQMTEVVFSPQLIRDDQGRSRQITEDDGAAMAGGEVEIWTTQRGRLSASGVYADGGKGLLGGTGGHGGEVSLLANDSALLVIATANGGPGGHGVASFTQDKADGGAGGNAGSVVSSSASHLYLGRFNADGGVGGEGAPGDENHRDGYVGGRGGDGGGVRATTKTPLAEFYSLTASGGRGGFGGKATDVHDSPETARGIGGRGGDGGRSGYVWETVNGAAGTVEYAGGRGGTGGLGGAGGTSEDSAGTPGGPGGAGGQGGDAGGPNAVPGEGGPGGPGGRGGSGTPPGPDGADGDDGASGAQSGTPFVSPVTPPAGEKDLWTLLVFIAGDIEGVGHRAKYTQALVEAVNAMEQVQLSSTPVNVLVFWDRNAFPEYMGLGGGFRVVVPTEAPWGQWSNSRYGWVPYSPDGFFEGWPSAPVLHTALLPLGTGTSELHTDTPATWIEFARKAAKLAPAEHYAVIYLGHGAGYRGLAQDLTDLRKSTLGFMKMDELAATVEGMAGVLPTGKIDVFATFGCQLGTIEVATELAGRVDFFVASQTGVAGSQYGFRDWLAWLAANPDLDGGDLARLILEHSGLEAKSVVMLNQVPFLNASLLRLSQLVQAASPPDLASVHEAIPALSEFEYAQVLDKDLGDFLAALAGSTFTDPELGRASAHALDQYGWAILAHEGPGTGLSIYLPRCSAGLASDYDRRVTFASASSARPRHADWRRFLETLHGAASPCGSQVVRESTDFGDTTTQALALNVTTSAAYVSGAIATSTDADFLAIQATAGHALLADLAVSGPAETGLLMTVYAPDGQTVLSQTSGTRVVLSGTSLLQTGTYFVGLTLGPGETNAPQSYQVRLVTGPTEDLRPSLAVSSSTLDFGILRTPEAANRTLVLTNRGLTELILTTEAASDLFTVDCFGCLSPLVIGPRSTLGLTVQCLPLTNGVARATLRLVPTDPAVPAVEVPLRAEIDLRPSLGSPRYEPAKGFSTVVWGEAGVVYHLEASSDLVHWHGWTNISSHTIATPLRDPGSIAAPQRFYRLR